MLIRYKKTMRVIMISTDRKIFEEGSAVRERMIEYGNLFDELRIIVFTKRTLDSGVKLKGASPIKITENVFVYPTYSLNRWLYVFDAVKRGRKIIRHIRPSRLTGRLLVKDVVVTSQDPFETALAAWIISFLGTFTFHIQAHTDFLNPHFAEHSLANRFRIFLAAFLLPRAGSIRVVSEVIAASLVGHFSISPEKITILPIFVDGRAISDQRPSFDLHARYPQFRFIILMASRLEREKNVHFAISVVREVVKKYPLTGLVIVGDGSEKKALQKYVRALNLDGNVVFEPWQADLVSYFKTANCFLLTSLYEGYGMTLIEAALAGLPIITSEVGVASKLKEKEAALVCPVGDVGCFVDALFSTIEDNQKREMLRLAGKEAVLSMLIGKRKYLSTFKESIEKAL